MSWLRIEGRMPNHRKVAPLSDAAFRLHITAKCWCVEERTDGAIPKKIPVTLPRAPAGKTLTKVTKELVDAGLWHDKGDHFEIHDFLTYNLSAAEYEAKAAAGAAGGRRSGEVRQAKQKQVLPETEAGASSQLQQKRSSDEAPPQADPESESGREIPPNPPRRIGHLPTAESLFAQPTWQRPDVLRWHERWKRVFGFVNHKLRANSPEADCIADAFDAHGEETCNRVLDWAPNDGMVSGRDDEKRVKHESILYILGNEQAFARMERDSREAKKGTEVSGVSVVERLRAREAQ